ncbi:MAG: hypothetical protein GEU75_11920 [Dehalococcoidia bacterium]|nr:hypothetical protein [Dehalococcoidia bacterium]
MEPRPISVSESPSGEPLAVLLHKTWQPVSIARGVWYIDQHWWRGKAVRRAYYRVVHEAGAPLTIFKDLVDGQWFGQEY